MDIDEEGRQLALRAAHLVENVVVIAIGEIARAALRHRVEQAVAQRILGRKVGDIELPSHRLGRRLQQGFFALLRRVGIVVPPAVILVANAAIGLAYRRQGEAGFVVFLE